MMTYVEIFPVGLIVTLISSLILKKKNPACRQAGVKEQTNNNYQAEIKVRVKEKRKL